MNHMKIHEYDEHARQEPHQEGLTERKIQLIVRERGVAHALSKKLAAIALFLVLVVNEKKAVRQRDEQRSDEQRTRELLLGLELVQLAVEFEGRVHVVEAVLGDEQSQEDRVEVTRRYAEVVDEAGEIRGLVDVVVEQMSAQEKVGQHRRQVVHEVGESEQGQVEDALLADELLLREDYDADEVRDEAQVVQRGHVVFYGGAPWRECGQNVV